MAKLADAQALSSCALGRAGSSPALGTKNKVKLTYGDLHIDQDSIEEGREYSRKLQEMLLHAARDEMNEKMKMNEVELFAWIGEDEYGSGTVGLKQARVPAGTIPMVAVSKDRMSQQYIQDQMKRQATVFGKTIRLCKFVFSEVVIEVVPPGGEKL